MIDGELLKMRDTFKKEKVNFLDIPKDFIIDQAYNGLSFETDIKREDVVAVINGDVDGLDSKIVSLISNHKNAFMHVVDMVRNSIPMTESNLKDLHQILMDGRSNLGGLYRKVDISIKGSNHTPPSHIKVYDRMKKYFDYTLEEPKGDLLEFISYCHLQLAKIHPFLDGNGRLARIVLNFHLLKNEMLPVIVTYEERLKYFSLLEEYKVNKNIIPFKNFLVELEKKSQSKYF